MKNFAQNLAKNKTLITIIAGIVCIVILFVAYNYRVNKEINPIDVPFAVTDIPPRTMITEDMVGTIKVAASMVTSTVVRAKSNVVGKYVNYNTYIPEGSLFYSTAIVTWDMMPDSAWADIEKDKTIVYFPVTEKTTYGNSIFPGDKIDLYYQTYDGGKLVYGKFIEGIEILAVKDGYGNHIFKKSSQQQNASALIFAVDEEYHLLFRKAAAVSGWASLIPIPRNANYSPDSATVSSAYLRNLIEQHTFEVPLDEDNTQPGEGGDDEIIVQDENITVTE